MAIEDEIKLVVAYCGKITGSSEPTGVKAGSDRIVRDGPCSIEPLCWDGKCTADSATKAIVFSPGVAAIAGEKAVLIGNAAETAAIGHLVPPGVIISGGFSGCMFFLARDAASNILGVHSYRVNGKYPDPMPYFARTGAKLMYYFDSRGKFSDVLDKDGKRCFGTVVCCVGATALDVYFVAVSNTDGQIVRVIDNKRIEEWRSYSIPTPKIDMTPSVTYPKPPSNTGLKKRIQDIFLKFIG